MAGCLLCFTARLRLSVMLTVIVTCSAQLGSSVKLSGKRMSRALCVCATRVHERAVSAFRPVAAEERKKILNVVMWLYFLIYVFQCQRTEQGAAVGQRREHLLGSVLLLSCQVFLRASPELPAFLLQIRSTWRWRIKGALAISSGDAFSC